MESNSLKPIGRLSVVDQIIERIIKAVSTGKYKTGSKLPSEYELMEELEVSRNSLREALKILSSMGIIEIKRGDGTYVCSHMSPSAFDTMVYNMIFDISSSEELIELRQVLDEAMIKLAVIKSTPDDIERLQENVDKFTRMIEEGDKKAASKLDYQFHMMILEMTKNAFLTRIAKGIYGLFVDSIEKNIVYEYKSAKADKFHQDIINCIKNKNFDEISSIVEESLSIWRKNIK